MKRFLDLLNLVLIAVILFFGVKIFYLWATQDLVVLGVSTEMEFEDFVEKAPLPLTAYGSIEERNLFKTDQTPVLRSDGVDVNGGGAPSTLSSLKLWGTATFADGHGFAVIEDLTSKNQALYRPGQNIQNARVETILRDKVILSINGKNQTLKMEDPKSSTESSRPLPAAAAPEKPSKQIALSRGQIDDAIQNINELMTQIKIRPHFLDGKPDGLAVGGILQDSIFTKMGLQNGDIIMGVNGEKILSVDDALKLYQSIKSGTSVNVELKRAGKSENLVYQID